MAERGLTLEEVHATVSEQLGSNVDSISVDADLLESGLHSIKIISIATSWRRDGYSVNFDDLALRPTVREWFELLNSRLRGGAGVDEPQ